MSPAPFDPVGWVNANPTQVQAWASLAAASVAVIALLIAVMAWRAERSQATSASAALAEAKRQADAADRSERQRRWDERIQAVQPIRVDLPRPVPERDESDNIHRVELLVPILASDNPVLDLQVILRRGPDNSPDAAMITVGTLSAGEDPADRPLTGPLGPAGIVRYAGPTSLEVTPLWFAAVTDGADETPYRLILNWTGQLGQWVVQEWDYDFVAHARGNRKPLWRMVRWHVDPKVDGIDAKLNSLFGDPATEAAAGD